MEESASNAIRLYLPAHQLRWHIDNGNVEYKFATKESTNNKQLKMRWCWVYMDDYWLQKNSAREECRAKKHFNYCWVCSSNDAVAKESLRHFKPLKSLNVVLGMKQEVNTKPTLLISMTQVKVDLVVVGWCSIRPQICTQEIYSIITLEKQFPIIPAQFSNKKELHLVLDFYLAVDWVVSRANPKIDLSPYDRAKTQTIFGMEEGLEKVASGHHYFDFI